jgi:hypothetical protein
VKSVIQTDKGCQHCKYNPNGIKPFFENSFHYNKLSKETKDMIANMAKKENLPEECVFCSILLFYWTKKTTY